MLKRNKIILSLFLILVSINCATYKYSLENSKIPVSFTNEENSEQNVRKFRIERKLTWVLFDVVKTEDLDLKTIFENELPNAKKIYNLKIESEENIADSGIRALTTALRNWVIWFKPLISRRTVVITGDVVEHSN